MKHTYGILSCINLWFHNLLCVFVSRICGSTKPFHRLINIFFNPIAIPITNAHIVHCIGSSELGSFLKPEKSLIHILCNTKSIR